jgi:hypothetical protein
MERFLCPVHPSSPMKFESTASQHDLDRYGVQCCEAAHAIVSRASLSGAALLLYYCTYHLIHYGFQIPSSSGEMSLIISVCACNGRA